MSTPTTPIKSTFSTPQSGTPKRKRATIDAIIDVLAAVNEDEDDVSVCKDFVQEVRHIVMESDDLTPRKRAKAGGQITQASSLSDLTDVAFILGLDYHVDEDYIWEEPIGQEVYLSEASDSLLRRMRNATFWKRESCEALSRTLIDIVIFDLLEANHNGLAARTISLRGEIPIVTQMPGRRGVISGKADYVLGYDPVLPSTLETFESISVIMEAKKYPEGDRGTAQALAYMVGVQQKRIHLEPSRVMDTTYGIVSDGISWQFMRLNGKTLHVSATMTMLLPSGRLSIYRFVDAIIKASISLSPYTTSDGWQDCRVADTCNSHPAVFASSNRGVFG